MKSLKGVVIVAIIAIFGLSLNGCSVSNNDYEMLNGRWDRGDIVVTFNGTSAVFTQINSNSGWQSVKNNGSIRIGDKKFRNIRKKSNLQWTAQELTFNPTTYMVSDWKDCTLTIEENGQKLHVHTPNINHENTTYTKQ